MEECIFCHGTGERPPPSAKAMEILLGSIVLMHQLESYTDSEMAEIAVNEIWANFPMGSREQDIVSSMIDRIKRSNQGSMPETELEFKETL